MALLLLVQVILPMLVLVVIVVVAVLRVLVLPNNWVKTAACGRTATAIDHHIHRRTTHHQPQSPTQSGCKRCSEILRKTVRKTCEPSLETHPTALVHAARQVSRPRLQL